MKLSIEGTTTMYSPSKLIIDSTEFSDITLTIDGGIGNTESIIMKKKQLRNLKDYITILLKD